MKLWFGIEQPGNYSANGAVDGKSKGTDCCALCWRFALTETNIQVIKTGSAEAVEGRGGDAAPTARRRLLVAAFLPYLHTH